MDQFLAKQYEYIWFHSIGKFGDIRKKEHGERLYKVNDSFDKKKVKGNQKFQECVSNNFILITSSAC